MPGRASRKAREYGSEIRRLRTAGYTYEAIRVALEKAGVTVSQATVRREGLRALKARALDSGRPSAAPPAPDGQGPSAAHPVAEPPPVGNEGRSGREIAEEFVSKHVTNPLLRTRRPDEDSRS